MKKIISIFLTIVLLFSIVSFEKISITALASSGTTGECTWILEGDVLTITGNGPMGNYSSGTRPWSGITELVIQEGVTSIGNYAFYNCENLTSITIPDSVTSMGDRAFDNCDSLTSVTIPNSVTSIGYSAFDNCGSLTKVNISNIVAWCDIKFGSFSSNPLYYAKNLYLNGELVTDLVLPDSVTSIGSYAFYNCTNLTSIEIPDSVTSIDFSAFYNCTSLTSIEIPDSVTSIGDWAFMYCTSLTKVNISNIAAWCDIEFGDSLSNPLYYTKNLYLNGELVTDLVLPDSVTSIGEYAFYNCSSFTSITIPDSVTSIGSYAFEYCSSLTSIEIPDSVTSIGSSAFRGCTKLESITLPFVGSSRTADGTKYAVFGYIFGYTSSNETGTVEQYYSSSSSYYYYIPSSLKTVTITDATRIPYGAFYNCTSLTSVTIGDSVTSIGDYAFYNCGSLTKVNISNIAAWCDIKFGNLYSNPLYYAKNLYLNGELVTDLVLPDSVTSIGDRAFYNCENLTSIEIPDSVTSIGSSAFRGCSSLERITLPFVGSSRTADGTEDAVFGYIFGDTSYNGTGTVEQYYGSSSSYYYYIPSSLKAVTITDAARIPYGAFYNCTSLTSITIPDSVTSIGNSAFYFCDSLETVFYRGSETQKEKISIAHNNLYLSNATWHYNSCIESANHIYDNVCDEICNVCDAIRIPPHDFEWKIDKENSCGVDGYKHEECTVCHIKRNENTLINATGEHKYDNNCDKVCNVCESVRSISHDFEWIIDKPNNCGMDGYKHEECSVCHTKQNENTIIAATGNHTYDNTCDTECNVCNHTRTIEHTYTNECDRDCNICGKFRKAPHEYDNDCDDTCNLCSAEREVGDHQYTNACDAVCNSCGIKRIPSAHVYDNACDKICNVCKLEREVPAHIYDNACDTFCNVCEAERDVPEHIYSSDCDTRCNICEKLRVALAAHTYSNDCDADCNLCCEIRIPSEHKFSNTCDMDCNICGHIRTTEHTFTNECDNECDICFETRKPPHIYDNDCDVDCNICKKTRVSSEHRYDNSCDIDCNECGDIRAIEHTYSGADDLSCNVCYESLIPLAPTVENRDAESITLVAVEGCEYSIDGANWQSSNIFKDLTPETEHTFYQRVKETEFSRQSDSSKPLRTKTLKGYIVTFCYNDGSNSDFTKIKTQGVELSLSSVSKSGYTFLGWSLTPNGTILISSYVEDKNVTLYAKWAYKCSTCSGKGQTSTIVQQYVTCGSCNGKGEISKIDSTNLRCLDCGSKNTKTENIPLTNGGYGWKHYCGSCYSENIGKGYVDISKCTNCSGLGQKLQNVTKMVTCNACSGKGKHTAPQPKAPTPVIKSQSEGFIELEAVSGAEYSINGISWQLSPLFKELTSGIYFVYQRYSATNINTVGEASEPLTIQLHSHTYSNACDTSCNTCGETRTTKHNYAVATCTKAKTCRVCQATSGKALGHNYINVLTKAKTNKNGKIVNKCSTCGSVYKTTPVYAAKTVKLSATGYTYNGKTKTPTVIVKDSKGKTISKSNYTVTYAKGRKNVGKYKVTVTFKGNYSGTKTLYFTINPVKTSVTKLTAAKKALTVSISKKTKQVTGYEIQYATNKKFSKAKKVTIKSYKTTKTTLKKLSAKKTYYVRVRTYKTVGKTKYYSGWSTVKYKKTK